LDFQAKTALSKHYQEGKEGLVEGISANSRATLSNPIRCWMHHSGGGITSKRGKSHIGNFGLATNLSLLFLGNFCFLCCVQQKLFSGRK
jgi:hypothetical protein